MRRSIAFTTTIATSALIIASLPGMAVAAPTTDELVRDVTPESASSLPINETSAPDGTTQPKQQLAANNVSLQLGSANGASAVTVTLEGAESTESDGSAYTPVGSDASGSAVYAQQLDEHQKRIITSIDDEQDSTSFRYTFDLQDNQALELTEEGVPFIYEKNGDEYSIVTMLSEPWAKDANGEEIPTSYSLENDSIVQDVNTEGAAYPIIADPTWKAGGAMAKVPSIRGGIGDVYLDKTLTNDFVNGNNFACVSAAAVVGLFTAAVGGVAFGIACGASALAWSFNLNHNQCAVLTVRTGPPPTALGTPYSGSWCK